MARSPCLHPLGILINGTGVAVPRSRSGARGDQGGSTRAAAVVPRARRRLPMLLLTLLPLVLGGVLLAVALAPVPVGSPGSSADSALAAALAAAVARGQDAILESADQAPLARVLGNATPAPATLDRARSVLDSLAASLGDP